MFASTILEEFRKFISRGNVIDLAVAFIMGAAFTKIVNSIVADIITPLLGIFMGGVNFSCLSITFGNAHIAYGKFIQNSMDFIIIAMVVFLLVHSINKLQEKLTGQKKAKKLTDDVKLLTEIRDLLKKTSRL